MLSPRELIFIDPAVADIPALIAGLRPGVHPVLLGGAMPASQEIARALRGHESLDAIHIVAHGHSGKLNFSAGALSLATIDQYAVDLEAIGEALGPDGDLLLWSCYTAEGAEGRAFVAALEQANVAPLQRTPSLTLSQPSIGPYIPPPVANPSERINQLNQSYPLNRGLGNNPINRDEYLRYNLTR